MDLGISGKKAVVCGGSQGLGKAIAVALAQAGVEILLVSRTEEKLEACAKEISSLADASVAWRAADLAQASERAALLERIASSDILINNSGGPPVGDYLSFSREDWLDAIESNMLPGIEFINAALPGMTERRFGRIINVTSHMVKAPVAMLSLSNGARAGLTGYVGGVARDVARHNVTINNLLPGQFDTDRLRSNQQKLADAYDMSFEKVRERSAKEIPAQRFGNPEEFGAYAAFLCSAYAGFITGQNLLMDGGHYPGLI